ncbi:uncharacterized protein [Branchiostoma lanceolatum]|uniref:uncharacterized protein n=1 Tax=Branchiostoma lanceolatum TaxID=7740 RepID=UPI0034560822
MSMPVRGMLRWAKGTATESVTQVAGWGRTSWQRASPWTWSGLHENTDPVCMHEDPDPTTDGENSGSDGDEEGLSLSRNYGEVMGYGGGLYPLSSSGDTRTQKFCVKPSRTRRKSATCDTSWDEHSGRTRRRDGQKGAVSPRVEPDRSELLVPDETEFGELFQESRARCYTALQLNLGPFLAVWWGFLFGLVHFLHVSVVYPLIALLYRGLGQPTKTCFREFLKASTYVTHSLIWTFVDPWVQYGGQLLGQSTSFIFSTVSRPWNDRIKHWANLLLDFHTASSKY